MIYRPAPVPLTKRNSLKRAIVSRILFDKQTGLGIDAARIAKESKAKAMEKRLEYIKTLLNKQEKL